MSMDSSKGDSGSSSASRRLRMAHMMMAATMATAATMPTTMPITAPVLMLEPDDVSALALDDEPELDEILAMSVADGVDVTADVDEEAAVVSADVEDAADVAVGSQSSTSAWQSSLRAWQWWTSASPSSPRAWL